uniref:glycosyltransferase n=1 Tax=Pararhodobacter marinus TaxID=2184063 RepID=UPI0035127036
QASTFPPEYRDRIHVVHDGIDTDLARPNPDARLTLKSGQVFNAGDEVLTYVGRNLEPYRGYHTFMRALPEVLSRRPNAHAVIVGGDGVSYGTARTDGVSWKQHMLNEVGGNIDMNRVHFTGKLSYHDFISLLQISRVHAYLSYPFVLSWSLMEAMSTGCHIVGSDTPPVAEVIHDGQTGQLVDFFDVPAWSEAMVNGLANPRDFDHLRTGARALIKENYDLRTVCLPKLIEFVETAGA